MVKVMRKEPKMISFIFVCILQPFTNWHISSAQKTLLVILLTTAGEYNKTSGIDTKFPRICSHPRCLVFLYIVPCSHTRVLKFFFYEEIHHLIFCKFSLVLPRLVLPRLVLFCLVLFVLKMREY